jgi:hypothetical protein
MIQGRDMLQREQREKTKDEGVEGKREWGKDRKGKELGSCRGRSKRRKKEKDALKLTMISLARSGGRII